jgi:hypothetical protein
MNKVTITIEEEVARWARIRAAEEETSLSRLVGEMLREKMIEEKTYQAAMKRYLSQVPQVMKGGERSTPGARTFMADRVFVDANSPFPCSMLFGGLSREGTCSAAFR